MKTHEQQIEALDGPQRAPVAVLLAWIVFESLALLARQSAHRRRHHAQLESRTGAKAQSNPIS